MVRTSNIRARLTPITNDIAGKQLVFVTNNSTKSRADYKKKFDKMGIEAYEVMIEAFDIQVEIRLKARRKKSLAPATARQYTFHGF